MPAFKAGLLPNISGAAKPPLAPVKAQVFKRYCFPRYFVKYFWKKVSLFFVAEALGNYAMCGPAFAANP